jgi:DNA-binding IclR family transcriptional regulator
LSDTVAPQISAAADRASQTLHRALDILEAVAEGAHSLKAFEARVGLTRSTTHRLASALVDRGLLSSVGRDYRLGGRLVQLGHQARERLGLAEVARPVLAALSAETQDATNLGTIAGDDVLYVGQAPGRRRLEVRHRVGDRNRIRDTALGRALLIDAPPERWAAAVRRRSARRPRRRPSSARWRRRAGRPRAAPGGRPATASAASPPRSATPAARSSPPSACPACRSTWTRRGWPS